MSEAGTILGGGEPLLARVRAKAAGATRIRLALGYLFLPGLAPLWDALAADNTEIHLLIGNTAHQPTDEQRVAEAGNGALDASLDVARAARDERDRVVSETADALRGNLAHLPRTDENTRLLLGLARGITDNRIRVRIYGEGRIHAKAYLFERADSGCALVGSSNLSLPSPGNPTELNVVVRDAAGRDAVAGWFDGLWAVAQDFSRDLVTELTTAWPFAG